MTLRRKFYALGAIGLFAFAQICALGSDEGKTPPRKVDPCAVTLTDLSNALPPHPSLPSRTLSPTEFMRLAAAEREILQKEKEVGGTTGSKWGHEALAREQRNKEHAFRAQEARAARMLPALQEQFGPSATITARPPNVGGESFIFDIDNVENGPLVVKVPKKMERRIKRAYHQEMKIIASARASDPEGAEHLINPSNHITLKVDDVQYPGTVMSKAAHGNLFDNLAAYGPEADPLHTLKAWRQMLLGLRAVHKAGYIHRDIKPMNFLVEERNGELHFTLTDLGIASSRRIPMEDVTLAGTPGYMSYNQARSGRPVSADDMESIGIVFKEMLMGRGTHQAFERSRQIDREIAAGKRPASEATGLSIHWEDLQFVGRYPVLDKFPKDVLESVHPLLIDIANGDYPNTDAAIQAVDAAIALIRETGNP